MTTLRQATANRANAMHSTGPKTPRGKAVVALNAVRTGLFSRDIIISGECEADLVEFGRRMRTQLAPHGELELLLADRIVSLSWRLRRAGVVEAAILDAAGERREMFSGYRGKTLTTLARYEAALERSLYRALGELKAIQTEREGRAVHPADMLEGELL